MTRDDSSSLSVSVPVLFGENGTDRVQGVSLNALLAAAAARADGREVSGVPVSRLELMVHVEALRRFLWLLVNRGVARVCLSHLPIGEWAAVHRSVGFWSSVGVLFVDEICRDVPVFPARLFPVSIPVDDSFVGVAAAFGRAVLEAGQ